MATERGGAIPAVWITDDRAGNLSPLPPNDLRPGAHEVDALAIRAALRVGYHQRPMAWTRTVGSLALGWAVLLSGSAGAQTPAGDASGDWPAVPPAPPEPTDKREWRFDAMSGTHGFVGMGIKPGMGIAVPHGGGGASDVEFALLWALRGGVLIDRAEVSLELAPVTARVFWPTDGPNLSALINFGYHLPLGGPVNWPFRVGAGVTAVNFLSDAALQTRLDAVGISIDYKHFLVDIQVPSFRHHTDFSDFSLVNLYFGVDAAYVF